MIPRAVGKFVLIFFVCLHSRPYFLYTFNNIILFAFFAKIMLVYVQSLLNIFSYYANGKALITNLISLLSLCNEVGFCTTDSDR